MESKKQLILLVLNELSTNSDENHPLTQTQIAKNISGKKYVCDRKTVCRNIKFLIDMGYRIKKKEKNKGFYMDKRLFSLEEIDFIGTAILDSDGKSLIEKIELSKRVTDILNKMYRRDWIKSLLKTLRKLFFKFSKIL